MLWTTFCGGVLFADGFDTLTHILRLDSLLLRFSLDGLLQWVFWHLDVITSFFIKENVTKHSILLGTSSFQMSIL